MLIAAPRFNPRARPLCTQYAATARGFGAGRGQGTGQRQQTRGFRWGIWSSLEDDLSQEIRRRHRTLKHKYSEQLNRRLSWEKHPFAEDPRYALKRMMKSYWHSSYPGGRFCDGAEPTKYESPDNNGGVRPGQNIEDVERGAMDHLIFGKDDVPILSHCRKRILQRRRAQKLESTTSQASYSQPIDEDSFIIDPITNRKVAKHSPSTSPKNGEILVKTFKDYRSQFAYPDDVSSWKRPSPNIQNNDNAQHSGRGDRHGQSKVFHSWKNASTASPETYNAVSPGKEGVKYDSLFRYRPIQNADLDANLTSSMEELARGRDDILRHDSAMEEAHGKFGDLKQPSDNIDEPGYKSAVADEVTNRVEDVEFQDVDKPNPITGEGDISVNSEPAYDGTDYYDPARRQVKPLGLREECVKPEVLRRYRSSIQTVEAGDFPDSFVKDLRAKYGAAELKQCTTMRHLGPDDERFSLTAEEVRHQYDDLNRRNEPEHYNKPNETLYSLEEELSKGYSFLDNDKDPVSFNETDSKIRESHGKSSLDNNHAEDQDYGSSFIWNESDGQPPAPEEELSHSETRDTPHEVTYLEPDGLPVSQVKRTQEDPDNRSKHDSPQCIESEAGPDDISAEFKASDRLFSVRQGHGRKPNILQRSVSEESGDETVSGFEALDKSGSLRPSLERLGSVKQGQGKKSNYREMLESLVDQHEQLSDAHDEEAKRAVKWARAKNQEAAVPKRKLTGYYTRDFPEEFEKSWTQTLASIPGEAESSYGNDVPTERESMDGGLEGAFGNPAPSIIQPALDRHGKEKAVFNHAKPDAMEPEGPITSQHYEHGEEIRPQGISTGAKDETNTATEDEFTNTAKDNASSRAAEESSEVLEERSSAPESGPVLYKILAYDQTMQKIDIAETTSLVPDFTSALSPADALLRLSHPTRFFPHFARLQAEGFEIVSGSGDVLVFRKVRPSRSEQVEDTRAEVADTAGEIPPTESPVNPIDMTGRPRVVSPASANFASPTGYVKYENLPEPEASNLPPPPPRVAYNINLRREEPVYSGPKYRTNSEQKQKKSLGKRLLVGGVWVAGISYGLGVVSEYFATGGVDGLGPQGL